MMPMRDFRYTANPARVLFGPGTRGALRQEVANLNCSRALVLSTPEQADLGNETAERLGALAAGTFDGARMHTPVRVTRDALARAEAIGADCVVAIGGGSTIGLGKALALRTGLPVVAVPTTYAGSEMTPILGETEAGEKRTLTDARVLPKTVIYDVHLTLTLPVPMSVTSGLNAMAHAVEALYARDGNPITTLMAKEAVGALARGLRAVAHDASSVAGRGEALYGAWLAGTCLGSVGMALHHKLCHVLGGSFDLPHAPTHAVILPHAVAYNADAAPQAMAHLAQALGTDDPVAALADLAREIGAPMRLADLGMPADGVQRAAALATQNPYFNPRPVTEQGLLALLRRAYDGARPLGT